MKILITTMHRGCNYGSALQVYALSEIIKKEKHTPIILDYIPQRIQIKNKIKDFAMQIVGLKYNYHEKYNALRGLFILLSSERVYSVFFKTHLQLTRKYNSIEEIKKSLPVADVYMTGSDQVWNSAHNQGIDHVFFLDFAPVKTPKIAYAASFGKSVLDLWEERETRELLNQYNAISVRENSGVHILKALGIKHSKQVLDPTLLLTKEEWKVQCPQLHIKEKYLLIYSVEPNKDRLIEYAKLIAKELKMKIYLVEWGFKKHAGVDKMISNISPLALMSYFMQADYIIASSFHGTAFSVNLNKPFISISPAQFNTRAKSLLQLVSLENRLIEDDDFNLSQALQPIDYTQANHTIEEQRKQSISFLTNAINNQTC